jgi:hypothetical protein
MAVQQRPIAIPEPVNQVDSLWRTTQALKEAVEVLQGIRGSRTAALSTELQAAVTALQQEINNISVTGGGGASELSDLTDVNTSTPTDRNVLVADGVDWESRALVEADISDLAAYATQLTELSDVVNTFTGLADGDVLTYDTVNGWQNEPSAGTYPTHTGEVTGDVNLSLDVSAITNQTELITTTIAPDDEVVLSDTSSGGLARADVSIITDAGYF